MAQQAPGKSHRRGISFKKLMKMFPTEEAARKWLESEIWPQGPYCPHCGSFNVQCGIKHISMTHRCRDCPNRPQFSVKSGTVMKGTKLEYRDWAIAVYLLTTNLKGMSSMKLHRELEITQKSAWHLMHRLRKSFESDGTVFGGPVEADETYIGVPEKNRHEFSGRHNARNADTLEQMRGIVSRMVGKEPRHEDLIADSGLGVGFKAMTAHATITTTDFPTSRIPVVNVAAVPQRSPLRYPGGKTWLVPHIREWLTRTKPDVLIEPFAGGAIVSLTGVMEGLVPSAVMIEIDRDVAAFWRSAFESGATLREWIGTFEPTHENLGELADRIPRTVEEHGFRTLVLNRTRRGGILAPGASFSRTGENGKGVASRWYPETLTSRLSAISNYADRLMFMEGDGMKILPVLLEGWGRRAAVFLDPPYTASGGKRAGSRLYRHSDIDHAALFKMLDTHDTNFLMTYDAAPEIVGLVRRYDFEAVSLTMKNTHHNQLPELVITSEALFA